MEDNTALDKYRRVAHVEEFYEIIRDVHEKDVLHGGYKKRYGVMSPMCLLLNMYSCAQLQSLYHGIPRSVVEKFVSLCPSCQIRKPQLSTPPLKPIIANGFFCRLQVSKFFVLDLFYNTL